MTCPECGREWVCDSLRRDCESGRHLPNPIPS